MKYLLYSLILLLLTGCGNQDYSHKAKPVLLGAKEENRTTEPEKEIKNESTIPVLKEENSTSSKELRLPVIEVIKEEHNLSKALTTNVIVKESNASTKVNDSNLSALEQKMKEEVFKLEASVKMLDMEQKSQLIANEKEIELAKLESQKIVSLNEKELVKEKSIHDKEIALAKIENEKIMAKEKALSQEKIAQVESQSQKEIELAKVESQKAISLNEKELAKEKSIHDKEIALAKLETQELISENEKKLTETKALNEKEVALAKLASESQQNDKDLEFYKLIAMIVAGVLILILLVIYFIHRRNKAIELKLHEEELMHQKYLEASKQHNEHVKKMLDIVTDEKTDKGIKKEIVRLLKEQGKQGNLIEHKK